MKHTILLAAASQANLLTLFEKTEVLLQSLSKKYFKAFSLEEAFNLHPVTVNSAIEPGIDRLVQKVEHELRIEKYARQHGATVEILHDFEDDSTLISESTVADLMMVDSTNLGYDHLKELVETVNCPILLLPENLDIECFVAVHDANQTSVRMMKSFVDLFNPKLRELPISLLMSDPDDELEMKNEKVFVNYLRLYFKNLGAQHMYDDVVPSLYKFVQNECDSPMLLVSEIVAQEVILSTQQFDTQVLEHPIFIFKD